MWGGDRVFVCRCWTAHHSVDHSRWAAAAAAVCFKGVRVWDLYRHLVSRSIWKHARSSSVYTHTLVVWIKYYWNIHKKMLLPWNILRFLFPFFFLLPCWLDRCRGAGVCPVLVPDRHRRITIIYLLPHCNTTKWYCYCDGDGVWGRLSTTPDR